MMNLKAFKSIFFFTEVSRICTLLLDMLKTLSSPLCSSWATPLVWGYVIRHYISVLKDIVDESVSASMQLSFLSLYYHYHIHSILVVSVGVDCEKRLCFVISILSSQALYALEWI